MKESAIKSQTWHGLSSKYKEWQDMMIKGKMKMKKKINKDGKQYYDFDYSRYQFYYSYPEDHIGLAPPLLQKEFIDKVLEKSMQNFSDSYLDMNESNWKELQNILQLFFYPRKPVELHNFIQEMNQEINDKIASLRIQKALRIKKMKGLFGPENEIEKSLIEFVESQIRSLVHKQIRIENKYDQMGYPMQQRLRTHQSNLKQETRLLDELQFSKLSKGDFVVMMRLKQVKQALSFNSCALIEIIKNFAKQNKIKIKVKQTERRALKISEQKKKIEMQNYQLSEKIIGVITEMDSNYFENLDNKAKLQNMIEKLDYISSLQKNVQNTLPQKIYSQVYVSTLLNYDQVSYVPINKSELKMRMADKISYYYSSQLINQEIFLKSDEHISYKVNNLTFLQLKALWETYNFSHRKEEGSLIKIRSMMRKELELVFSENVNHLLNIRQHSWKLPAKELYDPSLLFKYVPRSEKQTIMELELKKSLRFKDPIICSFLQLLCANNEKQVRQQVEKYVERAQNSREKLYQYRSLYYNNCCKDYKTHVINVLNHKLSISQSSVDPQLSFFFQIAQRLQPAEVIDSNLLRSYYMLVYLRCCQLKYQLMEVFNGQIMCMIKTQSRINLLWKKSKIPFEMSKQFICRFTEPIDSNSDPFDFLNSSISESHLDNIFKQMNLQDADKDYLEWKAETGVQVRRKKSENPLMEGKSIIYNQTHSMIADCLNKIQFLCSETISRRQSFLFESKLTEIVDRMELIYDLLKLEKDFQHSKLNVISLYCSHLLKSVSPQAIRGIYEEMSNVMHLNNIVDLTQTHFSQCYQAETSCLNSKAKILKALVNKQCKFQSKFIDNNFNNFHSTNFGNSLPELSSIYYVEQLAIQQNQIIQDDAEDLSDSFSETESQLLNTNGRRTFSDASSIVDASQYHLKVSFQQVLVSNSLQVIKEQNNKKEELMSRKRQKIINDSILGALLPRFQDGKVKDEYLNSFQFVVDIMKEIDSSLSNFDLQSAVVFLQEVQTLIQSYQFQQVACIVKPEELTIALNSAHRSINKFVEKAKSQGSLSSRGSGEHWLCISSKVMEKVLSGNSGDEVDQLRGLYICLNAVCVNDLNFKLRIMQAVEQSPVSQSQYLIKSVKQLSIGAKLESLQQLNTPNSFENKNLCLYKLISQLNEQGGLINLCIGNYNSYYRAICSYDEAIKSLVCSFNGVVQGFVDELLVAVCELNIMEKYKCCTEVYSLLNVIEDIDNKLYIRKKIDQINTLKKSFLPKEIIHQIADVVQKCCVHIPKFRKVEAKMSLASMANSSADFENYVVSIMRSSILINMFAQELQSQTNSRLQIAKIVEIKSMMPHVQKKLFIKEQINRALFLIFKDHHNIFNINEKKDAKNAKLYIQGASYNTKRLLEAVLKSSQSVYSWVKEQYIQRKKLELNPEENKFKFHLLFERNFGNFESESELFLKLKPFLANHKKSTQMTMLRQWIQCQLLIFGCSLKEDQLIQFRKMLCNPATSFPVFWEDNTKHIISSRQLSKMKSLNLDTSEIINKYEQEYLNEIHLKKVYKLFIQDLADYEFDQEPCDTFLVLYYGTPQFFQNKSEDWNFILRFCDPFFHQPISEVDSFLAFIKKTLCPQQKLPALTTKYKKTKFNLNSLKFELWKSESNKKIKSLDTTRRYLKQRLVESKTSATKKIEDEVVIAFYRSTKIHQILSYLGIQTSEYKEMLEEYRRNFERFIHEGYVNLNEKQTFILNMKEKDIESKTDLIKAKDEVLKTITANQYFLRIIKEKFFKFCSNLIDKELSLRRILQEDAQNQESSRDKMILKQTVNKILIPKVKLNPFLNSPLRIENYFFAGSAKISFIDQFLNKLRNRAVLIQLAEGGTGYLLKVNELDESVDVLCKAIVGFSEKQFADRFRTVFEVLQETKEKNKRLTQENHNINMILQQMKGYQKRQIKSLFYEKLNDYLVSFYDHQKQNTILVNLLKSFQNKMEQELNLKFFNKIQAMREENQSLRAVIQGMKAQNKQNLKTHVSQAKDELYGHFKEKAEQILSRKFLIEVDPEDRFETKQAHDSEILIKKLKMQKSFFELKIAKIESKFNEKISILQKKLLEQTKVHNLLLMQQEKNRCLTNQVKQLHMCSVENEQLKQEMGKKEEDQTMQKFRLLKVNQSLKGRIKRKEVQFEEEKVILQRKIESISKVDMKNRSHYSVQVANLEPVKTKHKSFHIKTQSSPVQNILDVNVWKDKWVKSEKKSQDLIERLKKNFHNFVFTKNGARMIEDLKLLIEGFQNKKIESPIKTILKFS